jgi:hypothetical protein
MTKYASKDVAFFVIGGYNVLGATTKIEDISSLKLTEALALGDTDEGWFSSGVRHNEVTQEGWFDDSSGSSHELLVNLPVVGLPMAFAPNGGTLGKQVVCFTEVQRVGYDVQLSVGEVTKANGVYGISGDRQEGLIVAPFISRTTAGNTDTTYLDLGAPVTNGVTYYGIVTALTLGGYTSLDLALRHSSDHITFVSRSTLAGYDAGDFRTKTQYEYVSGATYQYVSLGWSWSGAGSGQSFTGAMFIYVHPAV